MKLFSIEGTLIRMVVYCFMIFGALFTPWYLLPLILWIVPVVDVTYITWLIKSRNPNL